VSAWVETYRGSVFRWEVDHNGHLTVAYYFARFADAGLALLDALDLGPAHLERDGGGCVTDDCYIRYQRELRVNDIMHVTSGVIQVDADGLVLGHKLFNSENGALCTTVEQRVRHMDLRRHVPAPLTTEQRRAAEARRVAWDGPPRERRPRPRDLARFRDTARDTVKPSELDLFGRSALSHHILRFSAANSHAIAAFGLTPAYLRTERRGFSTFEFQLEVSAPLRPGDLVRVRSALLHVGTSSMRLLHVMTHAATDVRVAALEQLGVHLDMDARRPTPLPGALRDRASTLLIPT